MSPPPPLITHLIHTHAPTAMVDTQPHLGLVRLVEARASGSAEDFGGGGGVSRGRVSRTERNGPDKERPGRVGILRMPRLFRLFCFLLTFERVRIALDREKGRESCCGTKGWVGGGRARILHVGIAHMSSRVLNGDVKGFGSPYRGLLVTLVSHE